MSRRRNLPNEILSFERFEQSIEKDFVESPVDGGWYTSCINFDRTDALRTSRIHQCPRVRVFLGLASFNLDAMAANAARIGKWNLIAKPSSTLLREEPTIWISINSSPSTNLRLFVCDPTGNFASSAGPAGDEARTQP